MSSRSISPISYLFIFLKSALPRLHVVAPVLEKLRRNVIVMLRDRPPRALRHVFMCKNGENVRTSTACSKIAMGGMSGFFPVEYSFSSSLAPFVFGKLAIDLE